MDTVIPVDADWNEDFQKWLEPFLAVLSVPSRVAGHLSSYKDF